MALKTALELRRLTEAAWAGRSRRHEQGLLDRVNSIVHSVLRQAEEAARKGLREASIRVITVHDADDVEVLDRVCDELLKMGFSATWTCTDVKINNADAVIQVAWFPERT